MAKLKLYRAKSVKTFLFGITYIYEFLFLKIFFTDFGRFYPKYSDITRYFRKYRNSDLPIIIG